MNKTKNYNSRKKGGVSVEFALMIVFGVAVLIMVLGLFSDNIAGVSGMSGINNIFKRDKLTAFDSKSPDYKVGIGDYTKSNDTTGTAGAPGTVADYNTKAYEKLLKFKDKDPLTDQEKFSLAYWLTV
jgi:uncharacterized protein (UPF0333 family)